MDASQRLRMLRGSTVDAFIPTFVEEPAEKRTVRGPANAWDVKVALREAVAEASAQRLSDRVGFDAKAIRRLSSIKPRALSTGAMDALRRGVAIVDDLGFMRCPPGTPNAMEFTDFRGSNCGVAGAAGERVRLSIGAARERLDREGIGVVSAAEIATQRIGERLRGPQSRRQRLVEGVRQIVTRTPDGEEPNAWRSAFRALSIVNEGFSFDITLGEKVTSGYAIARKGRGIRILAADLFDENGEVRDEGALQLSKMIAANAEEFTNPATVKVGDREYTAERVVLGGWRSNEDEYVYFDVTDVFPQDMDLADAVEIGTQRNQQSIANLAKIAAEKAERNRLQAEGTPEDDLPELSYIGMDGVMNGETAAFIGAGGDGKDVLPDDAFETELQNAVRLFGDGGELESVLRSIAGENTLDLDNFTPAQIQTMLKYLSAAPGFEWVDPTNPDHLYLAIMQLSDNLLQLMDRATPEQKALFARWYDIGNTFGNRLAEELGIPEQTMHAITAVLSPQKDWDQNTAMAEHAARLLADEKHRLSPEVAQLAFAYAKSKWETRNGNGKYSHAARIARAEKAIAEEDAKIERYTQALASGTAKKGTDGFLESAKTRRDAAVAALKSAIKARDNDTEQPTYEMFANQRVMDLDDLNAAYAIRAHGEIEGGRYLGQPMAQMTKDDIAKGKSPYRLLAYTTIPGEDGPGDHTLIGNPASSVAAQSFPNYLKVVAIFRSGGDMSIIDRELGDQPKVRSFFNNLFMPNDRVHRDTTMDTHAVAGELYTPISANHLVTGLAFTVVDSLGTAQAYPVMRAAMIATAERWAALHGEELLPRQIQSITWEVMRLMVPATKKKFIVDRVAQVNRLGTGPKADPRFAGDGRFAAIERLVWAATVDLAEYNRGRPRGQKGVKREQLIAEVVADLGLPPLTAADILPRDKKAGSSESEE